MRFGDATAILLIVVLNALLGFYQERRAEAALAALEKMQTPSARVRRDNEVKIVAASRRRRRATCSSSRRATPCPPTRACCRRSNLSAEESSLTGESVPVQKDARAAVADDAPLGDRATMLFVGHEHRARQGPRGGRGDRPCTRSSASSSALIHRPRDRTTPLEEKLEAFGKRVLWACLGARGRSSSLRGYVQGRADAGTSSCSRP